VARTMRRLSLALLAFAATAGEDELRRGVKH
jgi:hypothetical protein